MSNNLPAIADFSTQLVELDKIQETCKKLLMTKHYQRLGEEGIHAIMAKCKALGIHPFEGLNSGFFVVSGRVGMSTEMMAALVRQRGHSVTKDPKSTNECVILHGKRADNGDTWVCSFSKEDAMAAGLWGTATWKKYPGVMLYNRCMSMLFRQLFPDLSLGAGYVEDELKEITRSGDYAKQQQEPLAMAEAEEVQLELQQPKKINESQVKVIEDLLAQLTPKARESLQSWITLKGCGSLSEVTEEFYPILKGRIKVTIDAIKQKEAEVQPAEFVKDPELPF